MKPIDDLINETDKRPELALKPKPKKPKDPVEQKTDDAEKDAKRALRSAAETNVISLLVNPSTGGKVDTKQWDFNGVVKVIQDMLKGGGLEGEMQVLYTKMLEVASELLNRYEKLKDSPTKMAEWQKQLQSFYNARNKKGALEIEAATKQKIDYVVSLLAKMGVDVFNPQAVKAVMAVHPDYKLAKQMNKMDSFVDKSNLLNPFSTLDDTIWNRPNEGDPISAHNPNKDDKDDEDAPVTMEEAVYAYDAPSGKLRVEDKGDRDLKELKNLEEERGNRIDIGMGDIH
jgi:hypothetical protein